MFNPTSILADRFADNLAELYLQYFSHRRPEFAAYISGAARLVLERIGNSDALYHNVEHTIMVTQVGQQIIRGRLLSEALTPEDCCTIPARFWSTTSAMCGAPARRTAPTTWWWTRPAAG